ncbi:MAG: c-type cytochrome [Myxococcota bacterium]
MRIQLLAALGIAVASLACKPAADQSPVELGKRAYLANCIACHNQDPAREGTLGPALAGSSAALVEARIMRAEYPPGYTPKRDSHLMPAQPFLKNDVAALAAYLASVAPK